MTPQETQRRFLVQLAVDAFNQQKGANYDAADFDIKTLSSQNDYTAVEVFTTRYDDFFRLRLHCALGAINFVGIYSLQTDTSNVVGALGDEVLVADAILNNEFLEVGKNDLRRNAPVFEADVMLTFALLDDDTNSPLISEDGDQLIFEDGI